MRFPKTAVLQANESCWPSCYNTKFITGIWFPGIKEFNPEKQNSINIHYQFPKVNQMFCYIKHCNHLFCPDFAKAIKYGCESFKIKSIFLRSIPHAQPHTKSTTLKQAASTGLRKFSTQLVHLLKRCIKYKIASAFLLSGENSTWDIKRPEYGSK